MTVQPLNFANRIIDILQNRSKVVDTSWKWISLPFTDFPLLLREGFSATILEAGCLSYKKCKLGMVPWSVICEAVICGQWWQFLVQMNRCSCVVEHVTQNHDATNISCISQRREPSRKLAMDFLVKEQSTTTTWGGGSWLSLVAGKQAVPIQVKNQNDFQFWPSNHPDRVVPKSAGKSLKIGMVIAVEPCWQKKTVKLWLCPMVGQLLPWMVKWQHIGNIQ